SSHSSSLLRSGFQKGLDLSVQLPSRFQSISVSVRREKGRHSVVRKMHTVGSLVYQNRYRRVRCRIANEFDHFFHDQRIAYNQPQTLWRAFVVFAQNLAYIESDEFHQI